MTIQLMEQSPFQPPNRMNIKKKKRKKFHPRMGHEGLDPAQFTPKKELCPVIRIMYKWIKK
jgi:hypothetical protein